MSEQGAVNLVLRGAIASVTFDRPSARNAMTWTMYQQLADICTQLARNGDVRVVTFRGAGSQAFVAGTDIGQFLEFRSGDDGVAYERRIDEGIALIERLPMPTIAAIDGWAVGGGLVIAAACDFRIATAASRFGVPIARTLGNTLSMANLARLQSAFGPSVAKRMLLLAEVLDARQAGACGFLHDTCAPQELDAAVAALCERLLALAPVTQRVAKEGLRRLASAHLPDGDDLVRHCYGSHDFREGVEAFVARRAPAWQGC